MQRDPIYYAQQAFEIEAQALIATARIMDYSAFEKALLALSRAERIAASGCGHTGIACRHFAHLMCCINLPARFISPSEAVHGACGYIKAGDVMILASRGGKTAELLPVLDICVKKKSTVIAVTENQSSPLAQAADIVLPMKVERETDRYNSQGTSSFIVMCAIFDALQTALIELMGYQNEQFALNHPGGAVGARLSVK